MASLSVLRQGLHVSVSQIKGYMRCPRQYELHYVRGAEPAFVPVALAFGSAFHAALAFFYSGIRSSGEAPPFTETVEVFASAWQAAEKGPVPLQEDEEPSGNRIDQAALMLGAFDTTIRAAGLPLVESVEAPFSIEIHDLETGEVLEERLTGAFDLVTNEGGRRVVVEHKTSARKYGKDQLRFDFQPTAYQMAARELGLGEVGLRYQVVTKAKQPAVQVEDITRGPADESDFLATAAGVLRAIDAGAFFPIRGRQCRSCPYEWACNAGGVRQAG